MPQIFFFYSRLILNEHTTGICVLFGAFVRYAVVCHPTRQILNKTSLRILSGVLLLYVLLALLANVLDMYFNFYETETTVFDQRLEIESKSEWFLNNCDAYTNRTRNRVLIDALITFLIPASISCFFYVCIMINLFKRKRNASRNKTLSISFAASWLLWVVCWTPNFCSLMIMSINNSENLSYFKAYVILLRIPLQILYSHLNPLIFSVMLKPFLVFLIEAPKLVLMNRKVDKKLLQFGKSRIKRDGFRFFTATLIFVSITLSLASSNFSFISFSTLNAIQNQGCTEIYCNTIAGLQQVILFLANY